MRVFTHKDIESLHIRPATCVDWVKKSFALKNEALLPPKSSLHPQGEDFINTMPCLLPAPYCRYGVKVVSRIEGAIPTLSSLLILIDTTNGEVLGLFDAEWITTMRTGAVAALAEQTLKPRGTLVHGFIGLGNTARATLLCMLDSNPSREFNIKLLKYKDQADSFIERFSSFDRVSFEVVASERELISASDVIISCVTNATRLFCEDDSVFKEGCLLIPIHTKGFQNCDLFFDKVFGDDTSHIKGFKYFDRFRNYNELGDVLNGRIPGRQNNKERILSYNIGIGLHDLVFACNLFPQLSSSGINLEMDKPAHKFWI